MISADPSHQLAVSLLTEVGFLYLTFRDFASL